MNTLINRERPAHWYRPDGTACHTVVGKNGKDRATNLRDAREMGLYPSVTSILKVKAKPGLEAWKLENAIMAALTLPRRDNEQLDAFAHRVVEDMDAQVEEAAKWGTRLHDECEGLHKTGVLVRHEETYPYLEKYEAWFKENVEGVLGVEQTVVCHRYKYAGRVDLVANLKGIGPAIIDLKTQKVKEDKPNFYPEWAMQLAAYRLGIEGEPTIHTHHLVSVVLNSDQPGPAYVKRWDDPEKHFGAFANCYELWCYEKNYTPYAKDKEL